MVDNGNSPKPTSLTMDLLGDFDRTGGREIRLKALVALGEELDISGPVMRVTLARLRERGWFDVRREGRESIYRFTPTALQALDEGRRKIFREPLAPWDGEWSMVIYTVPESDRQTRDELRKKLSWLGFGPLAPATWVCPHPRLDEIANAAATLPNARLALLTTRTTGLPADRAMAAQCWELEEIAADYATFVRWLRTRLDEYRSPALDAGTALAERVRLVNTYRHAVQRDPQLPAELQPPGWTGDEAHRLFVRAHDALAAAATPYAEAAVPQ
ncbi:PaaX family transcriptional regulator [Streptomyces cylindrosporus]|uniref:PaaX family transcriptional regulator n=1 Tax=Streptomyces cylindrosporus TaxID=2927583 RepID=A0ABS9Y8B7_9ACTN|nr:PaaX family transcriptional regulator C-terminal domain-containing protein [Streptomyces cylindrosporus]MCI3273467.1 PaaX family transcriptional regulator [Streptomyces cylindrosporus]